jgi:hypothetical protein
MKKIDLLYYSFIGLQIISLIILLAYTILSKTNK